MVLYDPSGKENVVWTELYQYCSCQTTVSQYCSCQTTLSGERNDMYVVLFYNIIAIFC